MGMSEQPKNKDTKYLNNVSYSPPRMTPRMTGPLDILIPWVIEFRVVGTPNIIKVPVKDSMLIGRPDAKHEVTPEIDVTPHGGHTMGVSRRHAIIRTVDNRITIEDLSSANGTYINEHILEKGKEYRIRDRDIIRLGHMRLQVHFVVKPSKADETNTDIKAQVKVPQIANGELLMIVDDDRNVTEVLSLILKHAGFKVSVKHSAVDAMSAIDSELPQGILTELVLPDMSGLDIIRYAHAKNDKVPIMVISSATGGYQMGQAIDYGVDMFLPKPVAVDELVRGIEKMKAEMRPV
jgi:CheY-like chemotaxis protein